MNQNEALVKSAIHDAVIRAVTEISADVKGLLKDALARETNETAQSMLRSMVDNLSIAKEGDKAVCQSPGYPTTWLSLETATCRSAPGRPSRRPWPRPRRRATCAPPWWTP